jgi:hypothetical protein
MRVRFGIGMLLIGTGLAAGEALQITTTPSHTATRTPTPTQTPTPTATFGPTVIATPKPTPWAVQGAEFGVNTTLDEDQYSPAVAIGADDSFLVVWTSWGQDGSDTAVVGRRFDKVGTPLSGEFLVNSLTTGYQSDPAIAGSAIGFVVVWESSPDAGGSDILARRFDAAGAPLGPEFTVNSHTTGYQGDPDVAMDFAGRFVVAWTSGDGGSPSQYGIFARRYDSDGQPLTGEFQVNTNTAGLQFDPAIDVAPAGEFAVVWSSPGQDGDGDGIFARYYDSQGNPVEDELPVNTHTTGEQSEPDVAMNDTGGFVATFQSDGNDGSSDGIFGRIFYVNAQDVTPIGIDFQINTFTTGRQHQPRVATGVVGGGPMPFGFITTWQSEGQDEPGPDRGIFAQRFANAPSPTSAFFLANPPRIGSEYTANQTVSGDQRTADVAVDSRGQFVIAWVGDDDDGYGVFARRFGFPFPRPMAVDEAPGGGSSNVNGILEPGERVLVVPSWTNTSATSMPLDGVLSNLTGPDGPSYTVDDATADYGNISSQQTNACFDCYEVTVSGARPAVHWDATGDETLASSGPLLGAPLPRTKTWALHVGGSFADVPVDLFYPFIETVLHNRVTAGGACGADSFCGENLVLRQQMAVFLLKARNGADFTPTAATGTVFLDVPASNPFAPWIEELARLGVVAGCGGGNYCPASPVTRQQMSVFLLKTLIGSGFQPGSCGDIFDDVDCATNIFAPYIEYLTGAGIAAGCSISPPLYCPTDPTKRKQMAVFLVKTFGLELYGPD